MWHRPRLMLLQLLFLLRYWCYPRQTLNLMNIYFYCGTNDVLVQAMNLVNTCACEP